MIRRPPRSTLFPTRRSSDLEHTSELQSQAEDGIRDLIVTGVQTCALDRKSTRLNSSHDQISYAVFCLRSEEHTSELQSRSDLVCRLLLEKKKNKSELQSRSDLVCRLLLEKKNTRTEIQKKRKYKFWPKVNRQCHTCLYATHSYDIHTSC